MEGRSLTELELFRTDTIVTRYYRVITKEYEGQEIRIIYINGKFDRVVFPFSNPYSKEVWIIFDEIIQRLAHIERAMQS